MRAVKDIAYKDLCEDFSSSYTDGKNYDKAVMMIEEYLSTKGMKRDGYMINLSTLPILLSNVLDVYREEQIAFHIAHQNTKEYLVKISIL